MLKYKNGREAKVGDSVVGLINNVLTFGIVYWASEEVGNSVFMVTLSVPADKQISAPIAWATTQPDGTTLLVGLQPVGGPVTSFLHVDDAQKASAEFERTNPQFFAPPSPDGAMPPPEPAPVVEAPAPAEAPIEATAAALAETVTDSPAAATTS